MKSPLYLVITGEDPDGSKRIASRTAQGTGRAEIATENGTLALTVDKEGRFEVLYCPYMWRKAQEESDRWTVLSTGTVGRGSVEVNNA